MIEVQLCTQHHTASSPEVAKLASSSLKANKQKAGELLYPRQIKAEDRNKSTAANRRKEKNDPSRRVDDCDLPSPSRGDNPHGQHINVSSWTFHTRDIFLVKKRLPARTWRLHWIKSPLGQKASGARHDNWAVDGWTCFTPCCSFAAKSNSG